MTLPRPLFFVHVPKGAGTSLGLALEARFAVTHADYDRPPHWRPRIAAKAARQLAFRARLDLSPFDCIHGHFPRRRHASPDSHFATVPRHPLDRALSHFGSSKHDLPETDAIALAHDTIIRDIKAGTVGFVGVLRRCRIGSLCRMYPGEGDLSGFLDVSFTDEIGSADVPLARKPGIDAARDILGEEIAWYERVRAAWREG